MTSPTFHWSIGVEAFKSNEGDKDKSGAIEFDRLISFVQLADKTEVKSSLTPFGFHIPDSILLVSMMAHYTNRVGLRISIISAPTRALAIEKAESLIQVVDPSWKSFVKNFVGNCDSTAVKKTYQLSQDANEKWLNEDLWSGMIPLRGGPALSIVGGFDQIARALQKSVKSGISEFILSGWPNQEELIRFDQEITPRFKELLNG